MADTLTTQSATPATVPASSIIATDDCAAAGHVQIIKLAISTDGSATLITADSKGLKVQQNTAADFLATVTLAAGTALAGDVGIQPRADNGLTTMNATSSDGATALTSTAQAIKASAGLLYGWYIYNPNTATVFVQFYNTAAGSVTVGTTNPLFMFTIPPLSAVNQMNALGITFSNAGFSWAATSTAGGSGAPTTALDAVCFYN